MTVSVRPAVESDATAACDVLQRSIRELCVADHQNDGRILAAWLTNKTVENVRAWVKSESNFAVVATENEKVLGFALLDRKGELQFCYVAPEILGRGAGELMLRALEAQAAQWRLGRIFLTSTVTAKAFYEHHGYACSGEPVSIFGLQGAFPMFKTVAL